MDKKKKHENMVQIVRSNIKNVEYRDLERLRDIIRKEIFNRDMKLISEDFNKQLKKLDKGLHVIIEREIEKKLRTSERT